MIFSTTMKILIFSCLLLGTDAKLSPITRGLHESKDLQFVLIDMLNGLSRRHDVTCFVVIVDTVYLNVFDGALFKRILAVSMVMIVVEEYEDLLSPNFDTLESLREARRDGCNFYIILLANGLQVSRLLRFGDRYRIIDTRAKYVMLHDYRLFHSDLHFIWKRIVNVIFLRYHRKVTGILKSKAWFDLSTVPFPNPIKTVFVSRRVDIWKNGRFHYNRCVKLHDFRLFHSDLHFIWKRIVNVIFLRYHRKVTGILKSKAWFDLSTVPFPNPIKTVFVSRRVDIWKNGRFHYNRLFSDLHFIWKRIVNVIFLRYHRKVTGILKSKAWFDLSTVPFPNPIKTVFVSRRVDIWKNGRFHYNRTLFADKTSNLNGEALNVVYLDHVPSVVVTKMDETDKVSGVEIEILNALSQKMNFKPKLYQPENIQLHKWGQQLANGTFSGLLGEMVSGKADVALGNLQYNPYHLELTDLSIPYTSQCWTFLTPEALTDNSWKTLILPFKLYLWIAVLLVLLITGTIFHGLAKYYMNLQEFKREKQVVKRNDKQEKHDDLDPSEKPVGLYLFGEIINSILYTYGMLLVVSLPKLPTGWSIRLLTGWYWLYCILLVVSYRASMTAILANPAPRVTIDTIKELIDSKVTCGGWGTETKKFFERSSDETQKIADRFEMVDEPFEAANKIAKGIYAYYDNKDLLKYLSVKRKNSLMKIDKDAVNATSNDTEVVNTDIERNLHIMTDCVVNIPISLGFHKNSPLKPLADIYLARIVEVGLVEKWLNDAMYPIRVLETNDNEVKALMNLQKLYGAFIALAIGYFLSLVGLIGELIHWHCVVKKDPRFDKYALDVYYSKNK